MILSILIGLYIIYRCKKNLGVKPIGGYVWVVILAILLTVGCVNLLQEEKEVKQDTFIIYPE